MTTNNSSPCPSCRDDGDGIAEAELLYIAADEATSAAATKWKKAKTRREQAILTWMIAERAAWTEYEAALKARIEALNAFTAALKTARTGNSATDGDDQ